MVGLLGESRQEIALHLHPEWLTDQRCVGLPKFRGPLLREYPANERTVLLRAGMERLREVGAPALKAFRAGSWGADTATLQSVAEVGIPFDSSLNCCFEVSFPSLESRQHIVQPLELAGVLEVPVTWFIDWPPRRPRPLHVNACSIGEFKTVLEQAYAASWSVVVIVLHSFEFTRVDRLEAGRAVTPRWFLAGRFEALCKYLGENRDRFETVGFAQLNAERIHPNSQPAPLMSSRDRTLGRYAEQLVSTLY